MTKMVSEIILKARKWNQPRMKAGVDGMRSLQHQAQHMQTRMLILDRIL